MKLPDRLLKQNAAWRRDGYSWLQRLCIEYVDQWLQFPHKSFEIFEWLRDKFDRTLVQVFFTIVYFGTNHNHIRLIICLADAP